MVRKAFLDLHVKNCRAEREYDSEVKTILPVRPRLAVVPHGGSELSEQPAGRTRATSAMAGTPAITR